MYADAYFKLGGVRYHLSVLLENTVRFNKQHVVDMEQGIGVLLFPMRGSPNMFFRCHAGIRVQGRRIAWRFDLLPRSSGTDSRFVRVQRRVVRSLLVVCGQDGRPARVNQRVHFR